MVIRASLRAPQTKSHLKLNLNQIILSNYSTFLFQLSKFLCTNYNRLLTLIVFYYSIICVFILPPLFYINIHFTCHVFNCDTCKMVIVIFKCHRNLFYVITIKICKVIILLVYILNVNFTVH